MAPMKCPTRHLPSDSLDESYTLTHLAHRWGLHRREIRYLLQSGQLPFVQVRGQLRVPVAAVTEFERKQDA